MCVERTRYWQDAKQLHEVRWIIIAQAMKQVASFWSQNKIDIQLLLFYYNYLNILI